MGTWNSVGSTTSKSKTTPAANYTAVTSEGYGLSSEFEADDPVRMPTPTDDALIAAAKVRRDLLARSGRASTNLSGASTYSNVFLGSV